MASKFRRLSMSKHHIFATFKYTQEHLLAEWLNGIKAIAEKNLVEPYHGSRRGVTTDNFFTSVALTQYLLTKNLSFLSTVWKNKQDS